MKPTSGTVRVDGRVAALIELGAGFHPEISGRENIYINGAVLGLSRRQIDRRYDDIVEFSGLADFIEEPVKNYSSGMYVRLGFAVAIHTDPDVLMVDEVLAVGDEAFSHRCLRRIEEFLASGRTLLLVSHSLTLIESICDRVLWLDRGRLRADGHPRRVVDAYRASIAEAEGQAHRESKEEREERERSSGEDGGDGGNGGGEDSEEEDGEAGKRRKKILRWGSREVEIERCRLLAGGEERYHLESGEAVTFEIEGRARRRFDDFVFGVAIQTPREIECWGTNTDLQGFEPGHLEPGPFSVRIECPALRLAPGEYLMDVAVHAQDGTPYDYRRQLISFTVTADRRGVGVYFPEHRWRFSDGVGWERRPEDQRETTGEKPWQTSRSRG